MKLKAIKKLAERIPSEAIASYIASEGGTVDAYFVHQTPEDRVGMYYYVLPDKTVMITMNDDAVFAYAVTQYLIAHGAPIFDTAEMDKYVASLKSGSETPPNPS
ncbi:hypothetical protein [Roseimicrobium sp. ORNL1]|uniref:hypothetical protein n=1 Tax=Roseimicrobium sp. ORNL1 TaxID=2711231 RepID=UPI0013E10227|nr:hypothetical protein [Roseimicrobium sp. ORNL1]QIF01698.1 hypothetical protein G5S37_09235 [Roseimicrobium sp. ORNL1]